MIYVYFSGSDVLFFIGLCPRRRNGLTGKPNSELMPFVGRRRRRGRGARRLALARETGASAHFVVIGRRLLVIGGAGERVDALLAELDRVEQRQVPRVGAAETRG